MRPRGPSDCSGLCPDDDATGVCAFLRPRGPRGRRPPTASGHVASTGSNRPRGTYKGEGELQPPFAYRYPLGLIIFGPLLLAALAKPKPAKTSVVCPGCGTR